jgi:class 3 adenylate cyclase
MTLPSGTVTFLFTDIEGSTKLAQEHPDKMPELLARHNAILNHSIETHRGFVFRIVGDSFSAAFHTASEARSAAEALREASTSPRTPQERFEYERELAGLRAGMDEKTFEFLWAEGQSMDVDQAIDLAMGE